MELNRRELLAAAANLAAVTALPMTFDELVKQPALLTPPPAMPRGLITPTMIVRDMIRCLDQCNTELQIAPIRNVGFDPKLGDVVAVEGYRPAELNQRKTVVWHTFSKDLVLSLDDYSERFVEPVAKAIYTDMEDTAKRLELGKPVLVMSRLPLEAWQPFAARAEWRGYAARLVREYSIDTDELLMCIDVLYGFTQA